MTLDDLMGDDTEDSSSARNYVQPSKEEFEECLAETPGEWVIDEKAPTKEYVYDNHDILPDHNGIVLRCYSTIDQRTDKARSKGADAIRLFIFHKHENEKMGGRKKTLRIETWCKNFKDKVESLFEQTEEYVQRCDECGKWMVIKEGKYGEFLGCIGYPKCENTMDIPEE